MSDSSAEQNEPKIIIDEDWKTKVESERQALDAAAEVQAEQKKQQSTDADEQADSKTASTAESQPEPVELPPADFATVVSIFTTQTMVALGMVPGPDGKQPPLQLPVAKHLIDILGVLEEKTKNNLTDRESEMLDSSLHQLRMVYLEVLKSSESNSQE